MSIGAAQAAAEFEAVRIPLAEWRKTWLPGLAKDGVRAGVNPSGKRATWYDLTPAEVEEAALVTASG